MTRFLSGVPSLRGAAIDEEFALVSRAVCLNGDGALSISEHAGFAEHRRTLPAWPWRHVRLLQLCGRRAIASSKHTWNRNVPLLQVACDAGLPVRTARRINLGPKCVDARAPACAFYMTAGSGPPPSIG